MVDFIRVVYEDKIDIEEYILLKENYEKVYTIMEYHSGEILYPYRTSLENMSINITDKTVYLKNSIHKLHNRLQNKGEQNYNDFKYSSLCDTLDYLSRKLIGILDCKLTQLEFGLNVSTELPAELIIRENIVSHKQKRYNHNLKFKGKGEYLQYDYNDYYIKIYDKAKQFSLDTNILRFEIRFIRKRDYNNLGIVKLSDIKSKNNLQRLFDYLIKKFDEMIIVDSYQHIPIGEDKQSLEKYLNYTYWSELEKNFSRQTKANHIKKFNKLLKEYNLLNTKLKLRELLFEKFDFLMNN